MAIFEEFEKKLQANPKSIVFTEGTDARILSAASKLLAAKTLKVILLGEAEAVKKAAAEGGFDITGAELLDPKNYDGMDEMVAKMVELRKGKMTDEQCREALSKGNYFGTMLVKMGKADCLLGGATYSTADTVRPALQLIKCKPGISSVSSCFIMMRGDEKLAMADCAINIDPTEDEIVESTVETAHTAEIFGIEPRVALLSYSTKGSGKGETVDKMRNATLRVQEAHPNLLLTANYSLTLRLHRKSVSSKHRAPRSQAAQTLSSSRTSTQATSAIRLHSVWAASTLTDRSCRV